VAALLRHDAAGCGAGEPRPGVAAAAEADPRRGGCTYARAAAGAHRAGARAGAPSLHRPSPQTFCFVSRTQRCETVRVVLTVS